MAELYACIFRPTGKAPPLALRRLKDDVARDLPAKSRLLHPRAMPKLQAEVWVKLSSGGMGAALKMLHHIRSVSVHPALQSLMQRKRRLASAALWPMGDDDGDVSQLRDILQGAASAPIGDVIGAALDELFQGDGSKSAGPDSHGAWTCD